MPDLTERETIGFTTDDADLLDELLLAIEDGGMWGSGDIERGCEVAAKVRALAQRAAGTAEGGADA